MIELQLRSVQIMKYWPKSCNTVKVIIYFPRLFFFSQTCRLLTKDDKEIPTADAEVEEEKTIPSEADFLYLWSTLPGKNGGRRKITVQFCNTRMHHVHDVPHEEFNESIVALTAAKLSSILAKSLECVIKSALLFENEVRK